jgi:parvulin-like peptidyl-prolyl isomerase
MNRSKPNLPNLPSRKVFTDGIKSRANDVKTRATDAKDRVVAHGEPKPMEDKPPRITNDTVAENREEVLASARKYIYPLQHSRHRVARISLLLLLAAIVGFFTYFTLALYKLQSTSTFVYDVTRVIPFPIAKAGPHYVAYENYLFELRHYQHYYVTQQQLDPNSDSGKRQLAIFKKQALQQVINNAYVKQIAVQHHITVSDQDIDKEIALVRSQNRLGSSDQVLADVLRQFWGWNISDFRRELGSQLLQQKVVSTLDTGTQARAAAAIAQLRAGTDFSALAGQISDDPSTKANGGQYGFLIDKQTRDVPPTVVQALFQLQTVGQISPVINAGSSLELVKLLQISGQKRQAAHITFTFADINNYITGLHEKAHRYIKV